MNKLVLLAVFAACALAFPMPYRRDDGYVYVPPELPCAFEIHFDQTTTVAATGITAGDIHGYFYKHSTYFKVHVKEQSYMQTVPVEEEVLIRPDIDNSSLLLYKANRSSDEDFCGNMTVDEATVKQFIEQRLAIFLQNETFEQKFDGEYKGEACTVYKNGNETLDEEITEFYVNKDGYVIAAIQTMTVDVPSSEVPSSSWAPTPSSSAAPTPSSSAASSSSSDASSGASASSSTTTTTRDAVDELVRFKITAEISYAFYTPASNFVITKDVTGKCGDAAYTAPTQELCPTPSSGSGSGSGSGSAAASTTKAAAVALFAVALIALL